MAIDVQANSSRALHSHQGLSSPVSPGKLISAVRDHTLSSAHQAALRFSSRVGSTEAAASKRTTGATLSQVSPGTRNLAVLPKSYGGFGRQHKPSASLLVSGPGAQSKTHASAVQGETWAAPSAVAKSWQNIPGGALKQAGVLSRQIEALSVRIQQQKRHNTAGPIHITGDNNRRPQWKADARTLLRPASAPCKEVGDLRRQASLPCVSYSDSAQGPTRSHSLSRSEAGCTSTSLSSRQARGSIRELYADWCAAVRMHAHASALSTAPATAANRAGAAAGVSTAVSDALAAPAFKGPRPVLQAVDGESDVMAVSAAGMDRLWLDQLKLTRCCIVEGAEELRMLSYQYNSISTVEHVRHCPELVFLDFYANCLTSLQGLHGLSHVRVLMLGRNNISCLTGLETLVALDVLDVHHNRIMDAAPVAALTTLRILNLSSNRVAVLPQLTTLTCLAELNLRRNCLTSLHCGTPGASGSFSNSGSNADADSPGCSARQCSAEDAVGIGAVGDGERVPAGGRGGAAAGEEGRPGLPLCLQRLFVSHNKVAAVGDVPALRTLTQLRELALDANPLMNATHEIVRTMRMYLGVLSAAARRQLLALCPTTLRALNGVQLAEDETRLISLKHRQECGAAATPAAPRPSTLHKAPWRRRRSAAADRPASAAAALPGGAVTGRAMAQGGTKRPAAAGTGKPGPGVARPAAGRGAGKGPGTAWVEWKDANSVIMHGDCLQAFKGDSRLLEARNVSICRLDTSVALGPETLQVMARLPMLHSLTLRQCGVRTLPQLRPLTLLSSLCELTILDSPVTRLALLRPFIAAMLPRVVLLNGEAQDTVVQESGIECIAPLLKELWDVDPDGASGDTPNGATEKLGSGTWGLAGVMGGSGTQAEGGPGFGSCSDACEHHSGGLLPGVLDAGLSKQERQHLVEDWVDKAVARAVDVEERWRRMEECWDHVICEVLEEWSCFSN